MDHWKIFKTAHYDFHVKPNSLAENEIDKISAYQERCFGKITQILQITPPFRLQYYFFDSAEEVGQAYGDNKPCNGFAKMPDSIYAVYNKDVQCIGLHEDAHLISYVVKRPSCAFLREGLAMWLDEYWWDRKNEAWVKEFLYQKTYIPVAKLLDNSQFFSFSDEITYPIAGAFVKFAIVSSSVKDFLQEVFYSDLDAKSAIESLLNFKIENVDAQFIQWIQDTVET